MIKQTRIPWWIGAFQMQLQNSFFYMSIVSQLMVAVTFWYTSGEHLAAKYAPWFNLPMMFGVLLLLVALVILLDYKFILPSRMAFNNKQSCSTDNPVMDILREMQTDLKDLKELKKIKDKMGIK